MPDEICCTSLLNSEVERSRAATSGPTFPDSESRDPSPAYGTYAIQSISTRSPLPGSFAAWTVVRAGLWPPNIRS